MYITIATVEIWLYATCSIHILLGFFKSQKGKAKKKFTIAFTKGVHHTPPPLPHWKITLYIYIQNQENLKNKKKELKTSEYFYNECITIIQGKIQLPWVLSELWFFNGKIKFQCRILFERIDILTGVARNKLVEKLSRILIRKEAKICHKIPFCNSLYR